MAKANHYGLILAGGRGTRFWPRSRTKRAKQVLSFLGDKTLIQQTVERLRPVLPPEKIWVLTNDHLRAEIVRQLPEVPARQILAEPAQRNTAPCIALAAHVLRSIDEDSVVGVFPADHVITRPAKYLRLVRPAFKAAGKGNIVVLGIQPRWAETGYGYIEFPGAIQAGSTLPQTVKSFHEKPDEKTAKEFVAAGRFLWNAGMLFWRTDVLMAAMRRYQPKIATLFSALPAYGHRQFAAKVAELYPRCDNISIDYAVLEKADNVVGLAADDIGWNDVGSWNAVHDLLPKDGAGNVAVSDVLLEGSSGNYIDARGKIVALLGVKDLVVVDTPDALLIADRSRAQEVGNIVKQLEKRKRDDLL